MRKLIVIVFALIIAISFVSCENSEAQLEKALRREYAGSIDDIEGFHVVKTDRVNGNKYYHCEFTLIDRDNSEGYSSKTCIVIISSKENGRHLVGDIYEKL